MKCDLLAVLFPLCALMVLLHSGGNIDVPQITGLANRSVTH